MQLCTRSHGWRQLVSAKSVEGLRSGLVCVGPSQMDCPLRKPCTNPSERLDTYTNESKPLALSWGWTPRLSFGVRVSTHVVRRMYVCIGMCEKIVPRKCDLRLPFIGRRNTRVP